MSSILTNESAMVALTTLRSINKSLSSVQAEISTGKSVANARDNAAIFAVSTVMQSDVNGFGAIQKSLGLASATVGVARSAAESVTDVLGQIKELVVAAQEENVDRAKIQTDITRLVEQIDSVVGAAQFNGLNLLQAGASVDFLASLNRDAAGTVTASSITVSRIDLTTAVGGGLAAVAAIDVTVDAAGALTSIETLIQTGIDAAAAFGSAQKRVDIQSEFVTTLTDNMKVGIGALTDADIEEASARLQSLQVQQQLGVQALSIANQRPQALLNLFR
jgi:flagellin